MANINKYHHNSFDLFDPFFDDFFQDSHVNELMKTDITDEGDHYELQVEVPAVKKENIKLSLEDGYLTISASYHENNDGEKKGKYIRKERHSGEMARSFYVGKDVDEEDVSASLNNGVLTLDIKKPETKVVDKKKFIEIKTLQKSLQLDCF